MSPYFLHGFTMALFVYGWVSVNMYLPILPQLERVFQTDAQAAKGTVTVFLLGFAVSQLIWGPLSDRFGRKPVLLVGLAISVLGALLTGFAPTIELFMTTRFLEALGLGVSSVVARAMLTDVLDRSHIANTMAQVATVVALVPAVAPIIGGYLAFWLSWQGIFFALALYGAAICLIARLALPETIRTRIPSLRIGGILHSDVEMLRNVRYSSYILIYAIAFGGLFGYYATTPYLFTRELGYSSYQYGYLLIFNVVSYVAGTQVSRLLVSRLGVDRPLLFALFAYLLSAVMFVVAEAFVDLDTLSVLVPISGFIFGAGLVSPAANAGAMTMFREHAGAATAFVGFAITISGAVFSGALAHLHIRALWQLGSYVGVITLISSAIYLMVLREPDSPEPPS
jgi:MFS transporter, DHA1 family, multidrug resistance protein